MTPERPVEVSSSAWLFDPERLFWIAGKINDGRPESEQIALELYPTHGFMGVPIVPGRLTAERIRNWQKEHGPAPIERIHYPFHYSFSEATKNFFVHSVLKEPGTLKDRTVALGAAWMTGTLQNRFAQNLAKEFNAGANAHVNLVEIAERKGKVGELVRGTRYVWVENALDYPRARRADAVKANDPGKTLGAVERNFDCGVEGVILGIDHAFIHGIDPHDWFADYADDLKKYLRVVHLAGSKTTHGLIDPSDYNFWEFVSFVKAKSFDFPVRFCLDLNPFEMKKLSSQAQLDYMKDLIARLEG